jgi:hypothetical protein
VEESKEKKNGEKNGSLKNFKKKKKVTEIIKFCFRY